MACSLGVCINQSSLYLYVCLVLRKGHLKDCGVLCNISNMRCSVSSPDETPRRELKIQRAAEYF